MVHMGYKTSTSNYTLPVKSVLISNGKRLTANRGFCGLRYILKTSVLKGSNIQGLLPSDFKATMVCLIQRTWVLVFLCPCAGNFQQLELTLRPGLLEAWLALTSVKYHGNVIGFDTS